MKTTWAIITAALAFGACTSHRPSAPASEDGPTQPAASPSAAATGATTAAPISKLDPLPTAKCTFEVVDPGTADGTNTMLGVSYGFSPRLGGSALPVTVTWTKRFRAVYANSPTAEIDFEDRSVHLRAQAAPEDLRLVPEKPIALTPWLTVRRVYAKTVSGDTMTLAYELPAGLTLREPLPALARKCSELDPRIDRMMNDGTRWCGYGRFKTLATGRDIALHDAETNAPIGTLRLAEPLSVQVKEESGSTAVVLVPARKVDTLIKARIASSDFGTAPPDACKGFQPEPRSDARGYECKEGAELVFIDKPGAAPISVGATRWSPLTMAYASICGDERGSDLVVKPCFQGRPSGPGELVVRDFAKKCRALSGAR